MTIQELQLKSGMSRVTSCDWLYQDWLIEKICYLKPTRKFAILKLTRLDLQILARKLLPFATIVRLAIFSLITTARLSTRILASPNRKIELLQ